MKPQLDSIVFGRVRDGFRVMSNQVEIFVTRPSHMWGGGVVARIRFGWSRDIEPTDVPMISREMAVAIAEDALNGDVMVELARLSVECLRGIGQLVRCTPAYRLTAASPNDRADTAVVHAVTGEVLSVTRLTAGFDGSVSFNTNFPGDPPTVDVIRPMRHAESRALDLTTLTYSYHELDDGGAYASWSPNAVAAAANLRSDSLEIRHLLWPSSGSVCDNRVEVAATQPFVLGGAQTVIYSPQEASWRRNDALSFGWLVFLRSMESDFSAVAEFPTRIWFDARTVTSVCSHTPCSGDEAVLQISDPGVTTDTGDPRIHRYGMAHEYQHTVQECTEDLGAGCARINDGTFDMEGGWSEGQAIVFGEWFAGWDNNYDGAMELRMSTYQGTAGLSDAFIHDSEIDGTDNSALGCNLLERYYCTATEACQIANSPDPRSPSHGKPRCMRRATDQDADTDVDAFDCAILTGAPAEMLDIQSYASSLTEPDVSVCVSNSYANGRVFANLFAHLLHGDGYVGGLSAMHRINRDRSVGTVFTQGANSFFELSQSAGRDFEISDAFHTTSSETFDWLDETTGVASHAEVVRIPRLTGLFPEWVSWARTGGAGGKLSFDAYNDVDAYLLLGDRGATYRATLTSTGDGQDLCIVAYDWQTGDLLAIAPGCSDASPVPPDAVLELNMPDTQRVVLWALNLLGTEGTYTLDVINVDDDYADSFDSYSTAHPLGLNMPAYGAHPSTTDSDIFRYDVPLGATGALTFSVTGPSPLPALAVHVSLGTGAPGASPVATGTGSVTVSSPTPGLRYYLKVTGSSGQYYTVGVSQTGCTSWETCNSSGTWDNPLYLPSTVGGSLWNALNDDNPGDENNSWVNCASGAQCDWYRVTLGAGERLTATVSELWDDKCHVELAVFAPEDQVYWSYFANAPGGAVGARAPALYDRDGSLDSWTVLHPQLSFVARATGIHRIRVRSLDDTCPRYQLTVATGGQDEDGPPEVD